MIRTNSRVALYARFSSDNQRSESIDAQIRAMEAYCKQHHYVIVKTYTDEARWWPTVRIGSSIFFWFINWIALRGTDTILRSTNGS